MAWGTASGAQRRLARAPARERPQADAGDRPVLHVKSGRHLPYESQLELQDLWNAEVDVDVVASKVQPFTLRYLQAGVLHRYTPDRLDHLACGQRRVVEIKDRPDRLSDEVAHNVAQLLAERGLAYEVRHATEIAREPAFSAVRAIQARRRTSVSVDAVLRVQALLRDGPRPVAEVLGVLSPGACGFAELSAFVVRRIVRIELGEGLHPDALVSEVAT